MMARFDLSASHFRSWSLTFSVDLFPNSIVEVINVAKSIISSQLCDNQQLSCSDLYHLGIVALSPNFAERAPLWDLESNFGGVSHVETSSKRMPQIDRLIMAFRIPFVAGSERHSFLPLVNSL